MPKKQLKLTTDEWNTWNETFIEYMKKRKGWAAVDADRILGLWAVYGQEFLDLILEVTEKEAKK